MIDQRHPNFPPSLSITPNAGLFANKAALEGGGEDAFGVEAQREAISRYGIAGRVWEAAYALCTYPDRDAIDFDFDPPFVEDLSAPPGVIELGSGTGVVAAHIVSAIQRATVPGGFVVATDLPDVCPLLQRNLGIAVSGRTLSVNSVEGMGTDTADVVFVRPLAWGNLGHVTAIVTEFNLGVTCASTNVGSRRLTHIICSDLVYFPELFGPLLRTLIHLTSPMCAAPPVKVVISYKIRSLAKETPFWTAFGLWFAFQPLLARRRVRTVESKDGLLNDALDVSEPWRQFGADGDSDRTFVFVAHRRPESIAWHIPETDKELIDCVHAQGTTMKKGDDTFETILFMAMGIDDTDE